MKESHTLRNTIIGTVIGGILLSLLQWLTGFLSIAWRFVLGNDLCIPYWFIFVVLFIILMIIFLKRIDNLPKTKVSKDRKEKIDSSKKIDDLKSLLKNKELLNVLKFFTDLEDQYGITPSSIETEFSIKKDKAKYYIDELKDRNLITFAFYTDNSESAYELTKKGRKFLVENKIID